MKDNLWSLDGPLSAERAKRQFAAVMDMLKADSLEKMKTRKGRDSIRQEWGCRIEGFEEEDNEWFSRHPWELHK